MHNTTDLSTELCKEAGEIKKKLTYILRKMVSDISI